MILQSLAETLKQSRASRHDHEEAAPITPAEFARRFEPHEERMRAFLSRVASGAYRELGIVPEMVPGSDDEDERDYKVDAEEDEDMDLGQGALLYTVRHTSNADRLSRLEQNKAHAPQLRARLPLSL